VVGLQHHGGHRVGSVISRWPSVRCACTAFRPPHRTGGGLQIERRRGAPVGSGRALDFSKGAGLLGPKKPKRWPRWSGAGRCSATGRPRRRPVAGFERAAARRWVCTYAVAVATGRPAACALAALVSDAATRSSFPAFTFIRRKRRRRGRCRSVFAEVDDTLGLDPSDLESTSPKDHRHLAVHLKTCVRPRRTTPRRRTPVVFRCSRTQRQALGRRTTGAPLGTRSARWPRSRSSRRRTSPPGRAASFHHGRRDVVPARPRYQDQGGQFVTEHASSRGEERANPSRMRTWMGSWRAVAGVHSRRLPAISTAVREQEAISNTSVMCPASCAGRRPIRGATVRRASRGSCLTHPRRSASPRSCAKGVPVHRCYRGQPVYLSPSVIALRTASGKGGRGRAPNIRRIATYGPGCARERSARCPFGDRARRRALHGARLRRTCHGGSQNRRSVAPMTERFAVVGAERRRCTFTCHCCAAGVDVTVFASRSRSSAERARWMTNAPSSIAWEDAVIRDDVDAVVIATPNAHHRTSPSGQRPPASTSSRTSRWRARPPRPTR